MFDIALDFINKVKIENFITIIIAIIGWLIAIYLQNRNIKKQHKIKVLYDIYKEFVETHKEIQDPLGNLVVTRPPFVLMDMEMVGFTIGLKKEYKGDFIPYSEQECLSAGMERWNDFIKKIGEYSSDFSFKFLKILFITEDWAAAVSPLLPIKKELSKEVELRKEKIKEILDDLRNCQVTEGYDWRKWKREDIEKKVREINENAGIIGNYLHDFMVLVHNELLSSYFGHKRPIRKTFDVRYEVLTKKGIVQNPDRKMIKKTEKWKGKLIAMAKIGLERFNNGNRSTDSSFEYGQFLSDISNGFCPDCKSEILIVNFVEKENSSHFQYACGHGWNACVLKDSIGIRELIRMKLLPSIGPWIRKVVMGWKKSGDSRIKKGVDYFMDVNRGSDEYHQIVTDHDTKHILHEEHESLREHGNKNKK